MPDNSTLSSPDNTGIRYPYVQIVMEIYVFQKQDTLSFWFQNIFSSIAVILGITGNIMSFVVMLAPKLRNRSYSRFFIPLAVSDTVCLLVHSCTLVNMFYAHLQNRIIVHASSTFSCILREYAKLISVTYSGWILILLSLERLCVVAFPFSGPRFWTATTASVCVLVLFICIFLSYTVIPLSVTYHTTYGCVITESGEAVYSLMGPILVYVVPVITVLALNIAILTILRRGIKTDKKDASSFKVLRMALGVCATFVLFTFTNAVLAPIVLKPEWRTKTLKIFAISNSLNTLNYALNFYLYLITGQEFRRQFIRMFLCNINSTK
ncbi:FMRFamide receptor-like [Tubulanus polymorphus]|uniref:FMRFamide receptor-like n=1 Tax=Tubulanus polymorphus TaxID=672921 RepID=UPI003DA59AA2